MNEKIKGRKLNKNSKGTEKQNSSKIENKKQVLDKMEEVANSNSSVILDRNITLKNNKVKGRKLKISNLDVEEIKLDKEIEKSDNLSITVMVIILILCFVIGGILGYMLYRIAINNSNYLFISPYLFR